MKFFTTFLSAVLVTNAAASIITPKLVFEELEKLGVIDANVDACVDDTVNIDKYFHAFATDASSKDFSSALTDLNLGLSSLSTSINDCNLAGAQAKLDSLAAAIKFANVKVVDDAITIFIDATDIAETMSQLAVDTAAGDVAGIAQDLSDLLADWNKFEASCDSEACKVIESIMKILQISTEDVSGACFTDIAASVSEIEVGFSNFKTNTTASVETVAKGFDDLAQVLIADTCQITQLGNLLKIFSEKLGQAVIDGDSVVIEYASIYDDLYVAAEAAEAKDWDAFGVAIGKLVTVVRAAGCESSACRIFIGLMEAVELAAEDYDTCLTAIDATGADFTDAVTAFEAKDFGTGLAKLAQGVADIAHDVDACDVESMAAILEDMAKALGLDNVAEEIGEVVLVLVEGKDITIDIENLVKDSAAGRYEAVGKDLGDISSFLKNELKCNTVVCEVLEGICEGAAIVMKNLKVCEAELGQAEDELVGGFKLFQQGDRQEGVLEMSKGMRQIGTAITDCGLEEELDFIKHEAEVFGLATAGDGLSILVHGFELYDDVYDTVDEVTKSDWRAAGLSIHKILDELNGWTSDNMCDNTWCYVVEGMMEAEQIIEGDIKQCESDFENAWTEFTNAYNLFENKMEEVRMVQGYLSGQEEGVSAEMRRKLQNLSDEEIEDLKSGIADSIKEAIKDIGLGLEDVAKGVDDCHLDDFAELLTKLAAELAVPEVSWIAEVLHIVVHGAEIVEEIGEACEDFGDSNYVRFGFDIAKLIKVLL
jgi:hypothetical protein